MSSHEEIAVAIEGGVLVFGMVESRVFTGRDSSDPHGIPGSSPILGN